MQTVLSDSVLVMKHTPGKGLLVIKVDRPAQGLWLPGVDFCPQEWFVRKDCRSTLTILYTSSWTDARE